MGNLLSLRPTRVLVTCEVVTARTIYNTLNDLTSYLLILDTRSPQDFKQSHIDLALNPATLENMLYHAQDSPFTTVIVYGDSNSEQNTSQIHQFCSRMNQHRSNQQQGPLKVLQLQEFSSFLSEYPFQCTNTPMHEEGRLYPSQITDNIFLSNFGVASSIKVTQTLGITHILNCTTDCPFVGEAKDVADSAFALNAALNSSFDSPVTLTDDEQNKTTNATQHDSFPLPVVLLRVPVVDEKDQQIHLHFDKAIQFICSMKATDKIIIHCKHGQSRSATVAAAYLIHKNRWTVDQALLHLKACRPKVCPNEGFILQLQSFSDHLQSEARVGSY